HAHAGIWLCSKSNQPDRWRPRTVWCDCQLRAPSAMGRSGGERSWLLECDWNLGVSDSFRWSQSMRRIAVWLLVAAGIGSARYCTDKALIPLVISCFDAT